MAWLRKYDGEDTWEEICEGEVRKKLERDFKVDVVMADMKENGLMYRTPGAVYKWLN